MEEFHSLLILMVVVWVMGKIFRMLSLPVIFGELLGGIIVGPVALGIIDPDSITIKVLAELGIFFLMLHAGLETDPNELAKGSKKSLLIALGGIIFPLGGGYFVAKAFGFDFQQAAFTAIAISATAIAVSVRILKDFKLHNTQFGHCILSAAIISDIIILVLFSTMVSFVETGDINSMGIFLMFIKILLFFAAVIYGGYKAKKYLNKFFNNKGFTLTLIVALSLGLTAELIGLHIIIGAFLAGLLIREEVIDEKVFSKIEDRIYGLSYSFLGPIFFTSLAFNLDFKGIFEHPELFISLFLVAYLGKFIGSAGAAKLQKTDNVKAALVGLTMNSRGAVDLIIISVGLQKGIIGQDLFSVLVIAVFSATLLSILLIKPLINRAKI